MSQSPVDRRKKPRIARRLPVRFGNDARMSGGTVLDIAEGGIRVRTGDPFPVNAILSVFVQFPRHTIRLKARVAWNGGKSEGSSPSMGLAFTGPEPRLALAYTQWVAEVKGSTNEETVDEPGTGATPDAGAAVGSPESTGGGTAETAAADTGASARPASPRVAPEPREAVTRRLESRRGQSYEALLEPLVRGWRLTVYQSPRQIGVSDPDFCETYPGFAEAEKALREFVRSH